MRIPLFEFTDYYPEFVIREGGFESKSLTLFFDLELFKFPFSIKIASEVREFCTFRVEGVDYRMFS